MAKRQWNRSPRVHRGFTAADIGRHIDYLCRPDWKGTTDKVPKANAKRGLCGCVFGKPRVYNQPERNVPYFQEFEFVSSVKLATRISSSKAIKHSLSIDWRPLFFAEDGTRRCFDVVFAGYGIVAPRQMAQPAYGQLRRSGCQG